MCPLERCVVELPADQLKGLLVDLCDAASASHGENHVMGRPGRRLIIVCVLRRAAGRGRGDVDRRRRRARRDEVDDVELRVARLARRRHVRVDEVCAPSGWTNVVPALWTETSQARFPGAYIGRLGYRLREGWTTEPA